MVWRSNRSRVLLSVSFASARSSRVLIASPFSAVTRAIRVGPCGAGACAAAKLPARHNTKAVSGRRECFIQCVLGDCGLFSGVGWVERTRVTHRTLARQTVGLAYARPTLQAIP